MNQKFLQHINQYHPIDWLLKSIERSRNANKSDMKRKENIYSSTELLLVMSDIALRISQNNNLTYNIPTHQEYIDFIDIYLATESKNKSKLIQKSGALAFPLIMVEQLKFIYPNENLIGRLYLLYSEYEDEIFEISGLKILNIVAILIAISAYYNNKEHYFFKAENLCQELVESLTSDNISSFLKYFSIDVKGYRKKLKELGLDKHNLYSFRLLELFPIISLDNNKYIVPSFDNLLYSITSNMNIHLLTHMNKNNKSQKYLETMGHRFEDYVRLLTEKVFSDISEARDIVPKNTKNAEFVIDFEDISIVVEVKKFILNRDTAFKDNIDELDKLLERHIVKAYSQIEATFAHIQKRKKIGIIITLGDIHMSEPLKNHLKEIHSDKGVVFLDNIILMSIGEYEALLANSDIDIVKILDYYFNTDIEKRGNIIDSIKALDKASINPFLKKTHMEYFDKMGFEILKEEINEDT